MSLRQFVMTMTAAGGLVLALTVPASAQSMPSGPGTMPPALPGAPDMRPAWQGAAAPVNVILPDARTRDAWLSECHRRTELYYDGYRKHRRSRDNWRGSSPYTYCEAYFDDYYRTAGQHGYAHGYAMMVPARPMMMAQTAVVQPSAQNCEETVTTTYEPVRTRVIPRRPAPRSKRVPDKRQRMD